MYIGAPFFVPDATASPGYQPVGYTASPKVTGGGVGLAASHVDSGPKSCPLVGNYSCVNDTVRLVERRPRHVELDLDLTRVLDAGLGVVKA